MRRRFFVERFSGGRAHLEGEAAHHMGRVLHAQPGQLYELSDGRAVFLARIDRVSNNSVDFSLLERVSVPASALEVLLLVAIVKFDRFEWALEKATELGVDRITPLVAERSTKALIMAAPKRAERWRRILRESAQQARCLRPPALESAIGAAAAFARAGGAANVLCSERESARPMREVLEGLKIGQDQRHRQIALAIGPEGGWTDEEFQAASAGGFHEASLGAHILRTETAVIAGLAAIHLHFDPD